MILGILAIVGFVFYLFLMGYGVISIFNDLSKLGKRVPQKKYKPQQKGLQEDPKVFIYVDQKNLIVQQKDEK